MKSSSVSVTARPLLCFNIPGHHRAFPEAFKIFLQPFKEIFVAKRKNSVDRELVVDEATSALTDRYTMEIYVGKKKRPMNRDSLREKVLSFFRSSDRQQVETSKNRRRKAPSLEPEERKKKKLKSSTGTESCKSQASKDPLDLLAHVAVSAIGSGCGCGCGFHYGCVNQNRKSSKDDENMKYTSSVKGRDCKSSLTYQGPKEKDIISCVPQGLKEESPSCSLDCLRIVSTASTENVPEKDRKGSIEFVLDKHDRVVIQDPCNDISLKGTPNQFDVLLGREKESANHIGNKRYLAMVALNRDEYKSCKTRDAKSKITTRLIHEIHNLGGRFLKKDPETGEYEEVHHKHAHEKVSHALRQAKDASKKGRRRKRRVNNTPPTPQENEAFEFLYAEQQRILQKLMAEEDANILGRTKQNLVRQLGDSKMTPVVS
jgi:hypothetical protein